MAGKNTTTRSIHRAGFCQDQRLCCSVFAHLGQLTKHVEGNLTTSQRVRISGGIGDARFSALPIWPRYVDVDPDAPSTLAIGVVNSPMRNFTFRAHAEYFGEPIAASTGALLTRVASADGR